MAFTFKGFGGTATSTTANQTFANLTTAATIGAVGDLAILLVGVDNNATTDIDEVAVASVTGGGNTFVKAGEFTNGNGAAQAGATCSIWFCRLSAALAVGSTIQVNFNNNTSRDASALSLAYFTKTAGTVVVTEGAVVSTAPDAVALVGSSSGPTCSTTAEILRVRAIASEGNTATGMTKTAAFDGTFTTANITGGTAAAGMGIRGEYDISTGNATLASSPTPNAGTVDHATVYVAFKEVFMGTLSATEAADSASFSGSAGLPEVIPAFSASSLNAQVTFNFGLTAYVGTAPTGFLNWDQDPGAAVGGSLSATEIADFSAFVGDVPARGTLVVTEAGDSASFTGALVTTAVLNVTDAADTASFVGTVPAFGTLSATEVVDAASFTGALLAPASGTLSVTEGVDFASFTGTGVATVISGPLSATDAPDTASFNGALVTIAGTLSATDAVDAASFTGALLAPASGTLSATDAVDTASFAGSLPVITGTLSATDGADSALFNGALVTITGTLNATDGADSAAFTGHLATRGTLLATDVADTATFAGNVPATGTLNATELTDFASFTGSGVATVISGPLNATDTADSTLFNGALVTIAGALSATDGTDTAAFTGTLVTKGTFAVTDAVDGASFTGALLPPITGFLNVTDQADSASFAGSLVTTSILLAIDSPDTAFFTSAVAVGDTVTGTLTATEDQDIARLTGQLIAIPDKPQVLKFGRTAVISRW